MVDWEVRGGKECGFAHDLWVGCEGSVYDFRKCRFIPPHQSLTRQLPPKGKPSVRCANMANMALHCGLPLRSALTSRLRDKLLAVFFPPKGKPSLHCANTANVAYMEDMSNISLSCGLPLRFALVALSCSAKGILQKGFPLGGRKLQAVCRVSD